MVKEVLGDIFGALVVMPLLLIWVCWPGILITAGLYFFVKGIQ